jgi:hypothetical protein
MFSSLFRTEWFYKLVINFHDGSQKKEEWGSGILNFQEAVCWALKFGHLFPILADDILTQPNLCIHIYLR